MATTTKIKLTEHVYSGGTVVFAEGAELTPEQAHQFGVKDDGTIDRTLGTDELRARLTDVAGPIPAEDLPADANRPTAATLADANADQVIDFLHANPTEVDRVADVEGARATPRKTVMEAIERVRSGG